jgi:hypothetical protein
MYLNLICKTKRTVLYIVIVFVQTLVYLDYVCSPSSESSDVVSIDEISGWMGMLPNRLSDYTVLSAYWPDLLFKWWLVHLNLFNLDSSATTVKFFEDVAEF